LNRIFIKTLIGGLIAAPIVLLILPSDFFDTGPATCLSVILLDTECLGCGITRAVQHAIHFEFQKAWDFNKLIVVVLPVLIFVWANLIYDLVKKLKIKN
jgi:hypothetical protein